MINIPNHMEGNLQYLINKKSDTASYDYDTAVLKQLEAGRRAHWAVIFGLRPFLDGNSWCVLWGDDLQSGICAFGDSPAQAIQNFDDVMISNGGKKCPGEN